MKVKFIKLKILHDKYSLKYSNKKVNPSDIIIYNKDYSVRALYKGEDYFVILLKKSGSVELGMLQILPDTVEQNVYSTDAHFLSEKFGCEILYRLDFDIFENYMKGKHLSELN